jgi:hypothetical protein
MSEPLRVALVCEGPTDKIVLAAILPGLLRRPVVVTMVQPMEEELGGGGALGFGWRGVRRWCQEVRAGRLSTLEDWLSQTDLLIIHLDGDVAREPDVACARPCPPAEDTADALRAVLLNDLGLSAPPPGLLITTPMDATEAWLLPILRDVQTSECAADPAARFIGGEPKLMNQSRKKQTARYRAASRDISAHWTRARGLSQLDRLERELAPWASR